LRFLLANTSDFDAAQDAVPLADMFEIDRWALARTAALQAEIVGSFDDARGVFVGGHYGSYEFHPVVAKLQVFCSEDLGSFYLDILKDRLYTTTPKSLARRSAQTALAQIAQAMLRWMAPMLSFTAEEAWKTAGPKGSASIFVETYLDVRPWHDDALLGRWKRIAEVRAESNRQIELLRAEGKLGSSLQAEATVKAGPKRLAELAALGDDLRFVLITSTARIESAGDTADGNEFFVHVAPSTAVKCERCWHYRGDVGSDPAHPTICGRCTSNLFGAGEPREFA